MRFMGRTPLVGAYVCPRGVFTVECTRTGDSVAVERRFEVSVQVDTPIAAADQVIRALRSAGITRADVAIAMRGFGVAHHVLQLPPARDDVLTPIVEREVRRLEPQLSNGVVGWIPLPSLESGSPDATQQRSLLTAAVPTDVVQAVEQRLAAAGYRLMHLTALPVAMQRLLEEFDPTTDSTALVAPLPDGAFLGFALNGALRLVLEPPLPQDAEHEGAALAEEVELGVMFVRQQFRGAEIGRITLVGTKVSLADVEASLTERLHVPAKQLAVKDLSPAALAALGAVLDARSARPLSLGGTSRRRREARAMSALESAAVAAVLLVALLGAWVLVQSIRTWKTSRELQTAQRRVEQDAFGLAPLRATANQRKMVREAVTALRLVANDRSELQQALSGIAASVRPPVRIDSLRLSRASTGWMGTLAGVVNGSTNARAVQTLHDLYRELPERLTMDSLHLDQLQYDDSGTEAAAALVRFQFSFGLRSQRKD